MSKFHPFKRLQ